MSWQDIASAQQKHRDDTISRVQPAIPDVDFSLPRNVTTVPRKILTSRECDITELPVEKLAAQIAAGELTAVETVQAFLRRAGLAQKLANCVTELLPERALERARQLDEHFRVHGKVVGPLHGIPISAKEHIGMKGLTATGAFVSWAGRVAEDDATLLKCLWEAGCVFFARTTEPQTLMHIETSSNLHGVTVNPFNTALTSGGSSGGEGALIGLRGSCLGIGTDIGGSIRVPAANNGLYGFKPTAQRLPSGGMVAAMKGAEDIPSTAGPLSTSIEGVKLFMQAALAQQPHLVEPNLVSLPWRDGETLLNKSANGQPRLKVAIMWHDGVVTPQPPVTRALKEVAGRLARRPDVTVVDWTPYQHDESWQILSALYFCDGGNDILTTIASSGEPLLPLSAWVLDETCHRQPLTLPEIWSWHCKRDAYREAYAAKWNAADVDVILCPTGPGPAPPLGCSKYWSYTSVWNLLDYPALIFPVTTVDATADQPVANYKPLNDKDAFVHQLYDSPETFADAPVSLQLVGRRFDDEKVITVFDLLKEAFVGARP